MSKRVFVTLYPSDEFREKVVAWEEKYKTLPVRWLQGKNLHITLIPPWYVEDVDAVQLVLDAWAKNKPTEPFTIRFHSVSFGPDPRRPRLIWASGKTPRELLKLKAGIEKTLHYESGLRDFKLHLTLARFREEDFPVFSVTTLNETVAWEDTVDSFVLMESHLSRAGADYEILARYAFTKPRS